MLERNGLVGLHILFQPSIAFHIETSRLFCSAKQMTGFYMKHNTGLKWDISANNYPFQVNNKKIRKGMKYV